MSVWLGLDSSTALEVTSAPSDGAYEEIYDFHNFGYVLRRQGQITVATYYAKLIFHLELPDWPLEPYRVSLNCRIDLNMSMICIQLRELLETVGDARYEMYMYTQRQIRRIHEVLIDLPLNTRERTRRGFLTDALSKMTGLATQDDLQALKHILEQVEKGIYESSRLWSDGARSLTAAFKLQQDRFRNVFAILSTFHKNIRDLQYQLMYSKLRGRRATTILLSTMTQFLSNNTLYIAEVDSLYHAVQALMSGDIPHFILSHDKLTDALAQIQRHLDKTQPHMTLSTRDYSYYYAESPFKVFRKGNILFLVINAPVTLKSLAFPFQLYDMTKITLPTPQANDFYCLLATDIHGLAFSRDSPFIIQLTDGKSRPHGTIWQATHEGLTFIDGERPTCASALIHANLRDIKIYCRYTIHKTPYPKSIIRLFGNTFLFTNITILRLHCLTERFQNNISERVIRLTDIQSIYAFDCHCDTILADEFRIVADLKYCNDTDDISTVFNIQYPINLAYLSEYFDISTLFNLTASTLLNESIEIQLPSLAVAEKELNELFAHERKSGYDLEMVINATSHSGLVYDNLAHFLFNQMIRAHDTRNNFDLLSVWTWLSILGWCASVVALILVIVMRIKLRSLTLLLMAGRTDALPILSLPKIITLPTTTPLPVAAFDFMTQWSSHINHIPNLLPVEVLILLCLIIWFLFQICRMLYKWYNHDLNRTRLILEIGDQNDSLLLPIMNLPYAPRYYRLTVNRSVINFLLIESTFSAHLRWNDGVSLITSPLNVTVRLPFRLSVPFWKRRLLKSLLQSRYYALIHIVNNDTTLDTEIAMLRAFATEETKPQLLYPSIN